MEETTIFGSKSQLVSHYKPQKKLYQFCHFAIKCNGTAKQ